MPQFKKGESMIKLMPSDFTSTRSENWMQDIILPTLFTLVLASCLAHLGYCALQNSSMSPQKTLYVTPAFAS